LSKTKNKKKKINKEKTERSKGIRGGLLKLRVEKRPIKKRNGEEESRGWCEARRGSCTNPLKNENGDSFKGSSPWWKPGLSQTGPSRGKRKAGP